MPERPYSGHCRAHFAKRPLDCSQIMFQISPLISTLDQFVAKFCIFCLWRDSRTAAKATFAFILFSWQRKRNVASFRHWRPPCFTTAHVYHLGVCKSLRGLSPLLNSKNTSEFLTVSLYISGCLGFRVLWLPQKCLVLCCYKHYFLAHHMPHMLDGGGGGGNCIATWFLNRYTRASDYQLCFQ
jgi:hypothetical protein